MNYRFTSESVTEGHPDKVCDQLSDAILDNFLQQDPMSRVACECIASKGMVFVMGEITSDCYVDIPQLVRTTIKDIGYICAEDGFDFQSCSVTNSINPQSADIAQGVNHALDDQNEIGAGDQGMMFGFACNETEELMPAPISYSHALSKQLAAVRKNNTLDFLKPDGKTQVTVEYDNNGKVLRIDTIVISSQHSANVTQNTLKEGIIETVIKPILPENLIDHNTKIFINPTGSFVIGGPAGDSGLTGRKIIVDTYGGYARHGGGAFSGKDPTKVDRSAAYMARHVAKSLVAAGLADKLEIELAYAIGVAKPVSVFVETFGTGKKSDEEILKIIDKNFDLRPRKIIEYLDLRKPLYKEIASYGHFGVNALNKPWEKIAKIDL